MLNTLHFLKSLRLSAAMVLACRAASAQEEFEGWHLEPGVGQAHLVMVARVASISRVTVVEGAKTDVALREFRFQPLRRLKGFFQRELLSMTPGDLGIASDNAATAAPLKEGEFRLLILVQPQGLDSVGCVAAAPGAATFDERVPLLTGLDDPLVGVVETLIRVADSRSRRERASLLIERLASVDGLPAVPLLSSLRLRADWATTDPRAYALLARLARNSSTAVHGAALEALRDMLASSIAPSDPKQFDGVAESLRAALESDEVVTRNRLAALESLGHLLEVNSDSAWARELLIAQLTTAASHAERAAAATALARIAHPEAIAAVVNALAGLPLDDPPARESVYARAAVRLDRPQAERALITRLKRSIAARQSLEAEVAALGRMRSQESLPLLLTAAEQVGTSPIDRQCIAVALGQLGDDRAVSVLARWLRRNDFEVKELALASLEILDSKAAASEVRPLLRSEGHLPYKLRLARLLARHGLDDGYALATEHLADASHMAEATLVLAALHDPRTTKDLSEIVAARPDRRWRAAALSGLAAIGDADARKQLLEILADDRSALAADAAEAAGLAGDAALLVPLAKLAQSRNRQIALASLVALRRFLSDVRSSPRGLLAAAQSPSADPEPGATISPDIAVRKSLQNAPLEDVPTETRAAIAESVALLVADAYVDVDLRHQALAVARQLPGDRYSAILFNLADQAELEGTPLLAEVKAQLRRSHKLAP